MDRPLTAARAASALALAASYLAWEASAGEAFGWGTRLRPRAGRVALPGARGCGGTRGPMGDLLRMLRRTEDSRE